MSKKYYRIHRIDEVNLKYIFLQSFPKPLGRQDEVMLKNQGLTMPNTSLGSLYQAIIATLDRLYEQ